MLHGRATPIHIWRDGAPIGTHPVNNRHASTMLCASTLCLLACGTAARAQTAVNFHDAFGDSFGNPPTLFVGQGAFADTGNDKWNAFAASTTASGIAQTSAGALTLIRTTATFGFTNGGAPVINQGLPDFLLGNGLGVNGATPLGTFSIQHVPPGSYDLYLYGTNYDHNRGTIFTVSSGTANGGVDATLNGFIFAYQEGVNYVLFHNVTPDASGVITGTWAPNPADGVGNPNFPGEGNFNGFQLVGAQGSIGACCVDAGCAQSTSGFCAAEGGTFHGVGSTCAAANCPLPGACCVPCTGCSVTTATACGTMGGSFAGGGLACGAAGCSIINGGFELGDFTGWTQFGDMSFTNVYSSGNGVALPHGGNFAAQFGNDPVAGGGIQQVIPAHVGDQVTIGFAYLIDGGAPNVCRAEFDGQTLLNLTDVPNSTQWTVVSYQVTAASNNPTLKFTMGSSPSYGNLDDITVCIQSIAAGGTCCRGSTCNSTVSQANCTVGAGTAGARYVTGTATCNAGPTSNTPCCTADFNKVGGVTVQDIFDFLSAWFAASPYANTGGNGTTGSLSVQNIFDFLSAWFAGGC